MATTITKVHALLNAITEGTTKVHALLNAITEGSTHRIPTSDPDS